jgi:hypothetical protein
MESVRNRTLLVCSFEIEFIRRVQWTRDVGRDYEKHLVYEERLSA